MTDMPPRATGEGVGEMREEIGDLWLVDADVRIVPTNGMVRADGSAVMGAGVAKEAARRNPGLADCLGYYLQIHGNHVYLVTLMDRLVTFPTKYRWSEPSDLELIRRSARELVQVTDINGWQAVALPRVGCGLKTGQLDWADVRAVLAPILDGRFVVVSR